MHLLNNVYLYNYGSAELMREHAEEYESNVAAEALRFDARTNDFKDPAKAFHIQKYQLAFGMYLGAAINYYYIALEGFMNMVYHSFIRPELASQYLNWEQRLDIDQKIQLVQGQRRGRQKNDQPRSIVVLAMTNAHTLLRAEFMNTTQLD